MQLGLAHDVPSRAISLLTEAGCLFTAAGEDALAAGTADSAIAMLDRACDLLTHVDDPTPYAQALSLLLAALAEAGQAGLADSLTARVDQLECAGVPPRQLILLRLQLARADAAAGEPARGIARIQDARALQPAAGDPVTGAALDAVAACLMTQASEADADKDAEMLARQALDATQDADQPCIACQAWEVLGILARSRDLADSTACFRRVRVLANQHGLPFWRLRAQLELGVNEWLATGSTSRLELVRQAAGSDGVLAVACSAETTIALDLIFRGHYPEAAQLIGQCQDRACRAGLTSSVRWLTLLRSVLAAHQCRRHEMETALREFRDCDGEASRLAPLALSLSQAVCALLEEDREQARRAAWLGVSLDSACPGTYPLAGSDGFYQLLDRIAGGSGRAAAGDEAARLNPPAVAEIVPFWNQIFTLFGQAVALGGQGREGEALAALARAEQVASPYGLVRHLGLRLVAEAAHRDGWGAPAEWLRRVEDYFHDHRGPAVANACRALLRRTGAPVPQRRQDAELIPRALRMLGVTVREFEVLGVLMTRSCSNADIAAELHISLRTVEKHVASLLMKTGQRNRTSLIRFMANPPAGDTSRRN
jgi:ATP/maltotriose-dependent transcriptional regulator MalT